MNLNKKPRKPSSDKGIIRKEKKKIYNCPKCDYKSHKTTDYKRHYLNNHGTIEERKKQFKYYCSLCDFGTYNKKSYEIHISKNKVHLRKL